MTPAQRNYALFWLRLRAVYESIVYAVGVYGYTVSDDAWGEFRQGVLDVLRWADLISASTLRYTALHRHTVLPDGTDSSLPRIARANPWYARHQIEMDPLIEAKADQVEMSERGYLSEKQNAIAQLLRPANMSEVGFVPLWRLERMRRDAVGEVAASSEQVQLSDPGIGDLFTHAIYYTRDDRRVRPTHFAMQNFAAWRGWEHWPIVRTPCGWNCRCFIRFVARHEAISKGWLSKSGRVLMHMRWPNSLAERNFESGAFPEWKKPRYWAWPNRQAKAVA